MHLLKIFSNSSFKRCQTSRFMVCMRITNPSGLFLTNLSAFTILRSVALLNTHAGKLIATLIQVGLAFALIFADSVRPRTNSYAICDPSYSGIYQYEDFTETRAYVDDPVLGASCYFTGYSVSITIIQRYVTQDDLFDATY